jgi:hypothetical protein
VSPGREILVQTLVLQYCGTTAIECCPRIPRMAQQEVEGAQKAAKTFAVAVAAAVAGTRDTVDLLEVAPEEGATC